MPNDVPPEILERIQKLLNLASKNTNEAEAASAASKAQDLLTQYNLDISAIEGKQFGSDAREQAAVQGGFYSYQRDLWQSVAELNFCLYWSRKVWVPMKNKTWGAPGGKYSRQHTLVGRKVNVAASKATATYLLQAVDRLVKERLGNDHSQNLSNWANSYRRGACARICQKLNARRNEVLAEEQAGRAKEERAADNASTSTALTLQVYIGQEYDANIDFIYGEGTSAKWAAERAQEAAKNKIKRESYTKWAAENPKEARVAEEKRLKQAARHKLKSNRSNDNVDRGAYWAGYDAGENISIDQQVDTPKSSGMLR